MSCCRKAGSLTLIRWVLDTGHVIWSVFLFTVQFRWACLHYVHFYFDRSGNLCGLLQFYCFNPSSSLTSTSAQHGSKDCLFQLDFLSAQISLFIVLWWLSLAFTHRTLFFFHIIGTNHHATIGHRDLTFLSFFFAPMFGVNMWSSGPA